MFSQALRSTTYRLVLAAMVLGLGVFFGVQLTGQAEAAPTQTTTTGNVLQSPEQTTGIKRLECHISEVNEGIGGTDIGCSPGDGDIWIFDQPTSDPKRAARVLSIALTAVAPVSRMIWGFTRRICSSKYGLQAATSAGVGTRFSGGRQRTTLQM